MTKQPATTAHNRVNESSKIRGVGRPKLQLNMFHNISTNVRPTERMNLPERKSFDFLVGFRPYNGRINGFRRLTDACMRVNVVEIRPFVRYVLISRIVI